MRLGIFGGTFNPIHFGHLRAAEEVREALSLDKVVFIPTGVPPLKQDDLLAAEHRYKMARSAAAGNSRFVVSDIEVSQGGKSYTFTTIERMLGRHGGDELILILGADVFVDLPLWWQPERLTGMIDIAVVTRPGYDNLRIIDSPFVQDAQHIAPSGPAGTILGKLRLKAGREAHVVTVTSLDISSTEIRRLSRAGRSITYLVPSSVEQYIATHGFYRV